MSNQTDKNTGFTVKKRKKITESYLQNAGYYYLQRFPASVNQFRIVMTRKIDKSCRDHPDQNREDCLAILNDTIIPRFVEGGLLNDTLFGQALTSSLRRKGKSTLQIRNKLKVKGLPQDMIEGFIQKTDEELMEHSDDVSADFIAAIIFARKKRLAAFSKTPMAEEIDHEMRNKEMAKFARQGFQYGLISRVMELSKEEAEDILYQARY